MPTDSEDSEHHDDAEDSSSGSEANGSVKTKSPTKKKRKRYSCREKLSALRQVRRRIGSGMTFRKACKDMNLDAGTVSRWRKNEKKLDTKKNKRAKSVAKGATSILAPITDDLLRKIFELREHGIAVSYRIVAGEASKLLGSTFRNKSREARRKIVSRFTATHGMKYRMGTHEAQKNPTETNNKARDFIDTVRPKVTMSTRDEDYVLNMDQTPVFFTYHSKKTLAKKGVRTVTIRKSTTDTKRATLAVTVSGSGKTLPHMLIFKGKANGRIVQRDIPKWPQTMVYACQENAWMDERCMLIWVEQILKPYVEMAPAGVVPLLFLDSYRCHMMASVVNVIQDLGVEVEHIPGGCTGLVQPVDVGINKPLKGHIREQWEEWMLVDYVEKGSIASPTREQIIGWVNNATTELFNSQRGMQIVRNAWRHHEYPWFIPTVPLPPVITTTEDSDDEANVELTEI